MLTNAILSFVLPFATGVQPVQYTVDSVERTARFAGKLGDLIEESLTVSAGGAKYTLVVEGAYHSRFLTESRRIHAGDRILVSGRLVGNTLHARRDDIRRAR